MKTFAAMAILAGVAWAASGSASAQVSKTRIPLTRAELKACILLDEDLTARDKALHALQVEHREHIAALGEEAKVLSELLRTMDDSDKAAVDAYNARNDARNAKVDDANKHAKELNQAADELREAGADYMVRCVSRPYLETDKQAVMRELGRLPEPARKVPAKRGRDRSGYIT